jgi:hypothetical protein
MVCIGKVMENEDMGHFVPIRIYFLLGVQLQVGFTF